MEGFEKLLKQAWFFLLLASVMFCALSWFFYYQVSSREPHCDIDSKAYLERGYLWYQTNRFVTPQSPDQPYYALGYPFLIGMIYKLVGGPSMLALILFQILLSLLSMFLIMRSAQRLFGQRAGPIAAMLCAFNLGYLVFTQFVLTEIVLSFLLLLFFERMTAWLVNRHYSLLVYAALALGCSIIIKPAALYFVIPMIVWFVLFGPVSLSKRFIQALVFAFFFYLPVVGYMTYNAYAFDNFALGTLDRVNLYYWYFPNVLAAENATTSDSERNNLLALSGGHHDMAVVGPLFWNKLLHQPFLFVRVWLTNVGKTLVGLYATNLKVLVEPSVHGGAISYFKMQGGVFAKAWQYVTAGATHQWVIVVGMFEALWSVLRYLLCLIACIALLRRKDYAMLALCCLFIAYFSLITGHDGCARFRMMFEFLLIALAAGGIKKVLE